MLLEKICKELGVKINEEWEDGTGNKFKINYKDGLMFWSEKDKEWKTPRHAGIYYGLITGQFNPVWKPKLGDYYWTIDFEEEDKVYKYVWYSNEKEQRLLRRELVFKTKEEAIKAANKMLENLKEEK